MPLARRLAKRTSRVFFYVPDGEALSAFWQRNAAFIAICALIVACLVNLVCLELALARERVLVDELRACVQEAQP